MLRRTVLPVLLFLYAQAASAQVARLPHSRHSFIVIAHRADHVLVPENTLAAIQEAIRNEVDYVELDLRTTSDSVLVIMHNETVDHMTDGKGKVSELTYARIRELRIADKRPGSTSTYSIPSFEEVLKTCKGKIHIYLDFKNASVPKTWAMIRKYRMEKQIIVYINEPHQYTEWVRLVPEMPLMVSLPDGIKTGAQLNAFITGTPVALLDGNYSDYTPELVQTALNAGIPAWPDIQSAGEAANWDTALATGFRGLQTDHPLALINYLKKKGLR